MPQIKRRQFLQFAGAALASIGLSQLDITRQGKRYGRVLAQTPGRKRALLVGINTYDQANAGWTALRGCINDVRMQKELLVHRFGFDPNDIVTLVDEQATRQGIVDAFQHHLIEQTTPDDVVVFHYSGHGSRIVDPNPYRDENPLNSTFVPIDSSLPDGFPATEGTVNDIMGKTLFLLMSQLDTERVTVVLDSCHSGGGKRGAVTFRARDGAKSFRMKLHPSDAERELQARLQAQLGWSDEDLYQRRQAGIAKGVVIASAAEEQLAADSSFDGFYAGAFTYLLTQYLWQQTGNRTLDRTFVDIDRATRSLASTRSNTQDPEFERNLPSKLEAASIYFAAKQTPPAEAIVVGQEDDSVQLWLGGVHPDSLGAFKQGATFTAVNPDSTEIGLVQLVANPNGLEAEGLLVNATRAVSGGSVFLQEQVRTVPNDLVLNIGIDESLADELVVTQEAIATIERLQPKPPGDDQVDYFIGRFEADSLFRSAPLAEIPPVGSVVLLAPDLSIVPQPWGRSGESVAEAVQRLQSKFRTLLATRIIRKVVNPGSSDLRVDASLNVVNASISAAATRINVRGGTRGIGQDESDAPSVPLPDIPADASRLPLDTLIEINVMNQENRPVNDGNGLYVAVLAIDSGGDMAVLYPTDWTAPDLAAFVESGKSIKIPDPERGDRFRLRVTTPLGVTEVLVIASAVPLRSMLTTLGAIAQAQEQESGESSRGLPLGTSRGEEFVEAAGNLLDDLNLGTRGLTADYVSLPANTRSINSRQLTALSLTFEAYDPAQES